MFCNPTLVQWSAIWWQSDQYLDQKHEGAGNPAHLEDNLLFSQSHSKHHWKAHLQVANHFMLFVAASRLLSSSINNIHPFTQPSSHPFILLYILSCILCIPHLSFLHSSGKTPGATQRLKPERQIPNIESFSVWGSTWPALSSDVLLYSSSFILPLHPSILNT